MAYINITVDGKVWMDSDTGQWQTRPPEQLAALAKPGATPQPWNRAIMAAILDAAVRNQALNVTVTTTTSGWTMTVNTPDTEPLDVEVVEL